MAKQVILCVDDERMVLDGLKMELKEAFGSDFVIEVAEDGTDALEIFEELLQDDYEIPVIICDYIMPEMKGDELLKQIHQISPQTLKILLTGQASMDGVTNAVNYANLYRYIAKPWEHEDLLLTINEAIKSYHKDRQLEQQNQELRELNTTLEQKVEERTLQLKLEKEKSDKLLLNTLPEKIVIDLKKFGKTKPQIFENVTILFSDIVNFTKNTTPLDPQFVIDELNEIFTYFDNIVEKYNCERIKTIGDAYLCVCGMPVENPHHALNMIQFAVESLRYLENRNKTANIPWQMRIGIHSGKVVGGIVGIKKYIYDVFGDAINTAARMETLSEPMKINVSEYTYQLVKDRFNFSLREPREVKGKGMMNMYFVEF